MPYFQRVTVPARDGSVDIAPSSDQLADLTLRYGKDNAIGIVQLSLAWVALLADTPFGASTKPRIIYRRFFNRLMMDPLGEIRRLSELFDLMANSFIRTKAGIQHTSFITDMKGTPIFWEYHHFISGEYSDTELLRFIFSFLLFGKKLYFEDDNLDSVALREWIEVEEGFAGYSPDPMILRNLRSIMDVIFHDFSIGPFLPVHGSGSVSENGVTGIRKKNAGMTQHPRVSRLLGYTGVPEESIHPGSITFQELPKSKEQARLKFVPKDFKKTRSICMEPVLFQYAQQGVRLWYESHMASSILRGHVCIHDQTVNQDSALFGSEFGLVDTIDLSSASDSMPWELVKSIFPPGVAKLLAATRTSSVELPNQKEPFRIKKFAPMGSALCFPVQSTVYSSIVILAALLRRFGLEMNESDKLLGIDYPREIRRLFYRHHNFLTARFQSFRVYGDDIVCDHRLTRTTVDLLRHLGFTVNSGKTFTGDLVFRESCGIYAFDGYDVTPIRYKVKKVSDKVRIENVLGILDLQNRAYSIGYSNLARFLKNFALYYPILDVRPGLDGKNPILFSESNSDTVSILCDSPRNDHLRKRVYTPGRKTGLTTSDYYQRDEIRSITLTIKDKVAISEWDNYFYLEWQRSVFPHSGNELDIKSSYERYDARKTRPRWRWTPI